jgi:tRNA threonylcarbamoyladenosine biosynthesis protein TsaB
VPGPSQLNPLLALDAGGPRVYVGLIGGRRWIARADAAEPALASIFTLTERVLAESGTPLRELRGFVFCDGPGSVLGLRLAAAAILTWQRLPDSPPPVFHYHSLTLVAVHLRREGRAPPFSIVTDWKKNRWLAAPSDRPDTIRAVDSEGFARLPPPRYHLAQRKSWRPPPVPVGPVEYPWAALPVLLDHPGLLTRRDEPGLLYPGGNHYVRWKPERHRTPATP